MKTFTSIILLAGAVACMSCTKSQLCSECEQQNPAENVIPSEADTSTEYRFMVSVPEEPLSVAGLFHAEVTLLSRKTVDGKPVGDPRSQNVTGMIRDLSFSCDSDLVTIDSKGLGRLKAAPGDSGECSITASGTFMGPYEIETVPAVLKWNIRSETPEESATYTLSVHPMTANGPIMGHVVERRVLRTGTIRTETVTKHLTDLKVYSSNRNIVRTAGSSGTQYIHLGRLEAIDRKGEAEIRLTARYQDKDIDIMPGTLTWDLDSN